MAYVDQSFPVISEETAKIAFMEYAKKNLNYKASTAKDMTISHLTPFCVYRYVLESFTESREVEELFEPYKGAPVDSRGYMTPPRLWDMIADIPRMFAEGDVKLVIPHTDSLQNCMKCEGNGWKRCSYCRGTGRTGCRSSGGIGIQVNHFHSGSSICRHCSHGKVTCRVCDGKGTMLHYKLMAVMWKNIASEFVTDQNSGLPPTCYKKVTGNKIFVDEQNMLVPIMQFPDPHVNQASASFIQQHQGLYWDNPRIRKQRHSVERVPLTKVHYSWKNKDYSYFVYGLENEVYTDNYPAKLCSVM